MPQFAPSIDDVQRLAEAASPEDPFAAAVRGARLPMVVTAGRDRDYAILFVNAAFEALTGYSREEVVGRNPRFLQGPGTDPQAIANLRRALAEGRELGVEMLNYRRDGSTFWNGMFVSPVRDGETAAYWFGSLLDVTARKEGELALRRVNRDLESSVAERTAHLHATAEQKTLLLHEVEHRVKNNLQLIASLLQFQSRRTDDPAVKEALRIVQERVSAVSTAHRRLFHVSDVGRFDIAHLLRDLVEDMVGRTRSDELQARFDLEPVEAPAANAAPLGLLISEILGHTMRSRDGQNRAQRLHVSLREDGDECAIELSDDGPVTSEALQRELTGAAGIVHILQRQLRAKIEWRDNHPGVAALIHLPIAANS
jgi:PAS domain S-box-containing protein